MFLKIHIDIYAFETNKGWIIFHNLGLFLLVRVKSNFLLKSQSLILSKSPFRKFTQVLMLRFIEKKYESSVNSLILGNKLSDIN